MRVGIEILPERRWADAEYHWRSAEAYGFDHAWTVDHLGWRTLLDSPWFDGMATLTAAAMATSRIRLGLLVASPHFRHPVPFARQLLSLDDISAGRFTLGIGGGGTGGYDATVLGRDELSTKQTSDRFDEFVSLTDLLLRQDRTSWTGEYYRAVDARNAPGCLQRPRLPFLIAANGPRAMQVALRHGQGWVTIGCRWGSVSAMDEFWRAVTDTAGRFQALAATAAGDRSVPDPERRTDLSTHLRGVVPRYAGPRCRPRLHRCHRPVAAPGRHLCGRRVDAGPGGRRSATGVVDRLMVGSQAKRQDSANTTIATTAKATPHHGLWVTASNAPVAANRAA